MNDFGARVVRRRLERIAEKFGAKKVRVFPKHPVGDTTVYSALLELSKGEVMRYNALMAADGTVKLMYCGTSTSNGGEEELDNW